MPNSTPVWTNKSVLAFAGDRDPVDAITQHARTLTLRAMEEGWPGPPFDPATLAAWLGMEVIPREDIRDARTLPTPDSKFQIEFNPNRSRGRVRYSIAHEIAHTFFPDCAEAIRNRASKDEQEGDEWQLEMLCNIAAAEIIMPLGTFPDLRRERADLDELMRLRREYDVSTEALLLRYIRLTPQSRALFAASRQEEGAYEGRYRIDYAVASSSWSGILPLGSYLNDSTLVAECTAIGFTAKGAESWPGGERLQLECVGVPPYPGATYPRVIGIAAHADGDDVDEGAIRYLKGDALDPRGDGARIIVHVVNDRSKTWGGGFAKQAALRYPQAQIDFRTWATESEHHQLGRTHFYGDERHLTLASMVAQRGFGKSSEPRISYPALETCLRTVQERATNTNATVHMPRIGCGQAGGSWDAVSELVDNTLVRNGVTVTVYDLP